MKSIRDVDLTGKRVLIRCDYNVPVDEKGNVQDDFRIIQSLPTIIYTLSKNAKIILMTHLGNPKEGERSEKFMLNGVLKSLKEYLPCRVFKAGDCIGKDVKEQIDAMHQGEVLLLENVRFHKEEKENNVLFAKQLASLGDVFINDTLSVSHRTHASVVGVPKFLESYAGLLLEKEVRMLEKLLQVALRPFVVVVGGKKAKDKLSFVDQISNVADMVLLGNLIANEFTKENITFKNPEKIVFPPDGDIDIGPQTLQLFKEKLQGAKAVFWTGPLGKVEEKEHAKGSFEIAKTILESGALATAGGGDMASFLGEYGLRERFSCVFTGGSATLAFLAGEKLPGLEALQYYG